MTSPWPTPAGAEHPRDPPSRDASPPARAGHDQPRLPPWGTGGPAVAEVDGRFLSTEFTGGFLGRVLGMYAVGGEASFDWFIYEETT